MTTIPSATAADIVTSYTANALNQYTRVDGPAAYTPAYDAENRLIAAQPENPVDGDTRVVFTYDYMGRRGLKIVYGYSGGEWVPNKEIRFVYDGWNLVKETTLTDSAASVDRYYVWGLDLSQSLQGAGGVGGLLAAIDGSLTYHYFFDANGNVGQVVNAADGAVAAHYEYDPFGKLVSQNGNYAEENAYRFSTKYFDEEAGLYYYGYRYYWPQLGRWINRDPIREIGGKLYRGVKSRDEIENGYNHEDRNPYAFINNNGLTSIDYLGLVVKYCTRDLDLPKEGSQNIHKILHHSFIWINNETYGLTTKKPKFTMACGIEGKGYIDRNLGLDHTVATEDGYWNGKCNEIKCDTEDVLLNEVRKALRNPPYYCLNPNGVSGTNCQRWAKTLIEKHCRCYDKEEVERIFVELEYQRLRREMEQMRNN